MFIRTLLFLPLLLMRLLLETAPPAEGGAAPGAQGGGEGDGSGDKSKGAGDGTASANGDAASGSGAPAAGTGTAPEAGVDPRVKAANDQAAQERVKRKQAEDGMKAMRDAFAPVLKAMGIEVPGAEVDPQKLASEVESWKGKYRTERVSNTVQRIATELGGKADLTMRYLRGGDELAALDPDDPGFEAAAKAVVQAAIAAEPSLKAAQAAPGRSGGDFSAGANGAATSLEKRIQEAAEKGDWKLYTQLMEDFAAAKSGNAAAGSVN